METFTIYGTPYAWMVKGRESWTEKGPAGLIAHDILEHLPEHTGLLTDELEAYGAMFYTRNEVITQYSDMLGFLGNMYIEYKNATLLGSGYPTSDQVILALQTTINQDKEYWDRWLKWRKVDPNLRHQIKEWASKNCRTLASWISKGHAKAKERFQAHGIPYQLEKTWWDWGDSKGSITQQVQKMIDDIRYPGVYKIKIGAFGFDIDTIFEEVRDPTPVLMTLGDLVGIQQVIKCDYTDLSKDIPKKGSRGKLSRKRRKQLKMIERKKQAA